MLGSTGRKARGNTTVPLVVVGPIWTANRKVGASIHLLAKVDAMCLKMILYRMLIVRRYKLLKSTLVIPIKF